MGIIPEHVRLSYSQVGTYKDCAQKWYLERIVRLRPKWTSSPLIFGTALDDAVEEMLKNIDREEKVDAEAIFLDRMKTTEINYEKVDIPKSLRVRYSASDSQADIFIEEDEAEITAYCEELEIEPVDVAEFLDYCKGQRKAKTALDKTCQLLYDHIAYTSLLRKGKMILPELQEWIDKNVKRVISTQQKIEIENELGDGFTGYLDFIVELNDGKVVLIDLKTSSNANAYYPEGCLEESEQLAIYYQEVEHIGIDAAAYLVADKKIRKRDPRVRIKYEEGVISQEQVEKTFEGIDKVLNSIKEKKFDKNFDSCYNYGTKCPYFNVCRGGDETGLVRLKK